VATFVALNFTASAFYVIRAGLPHCGSPDRQASISGKRKPEFYIKTRPPFGSEQVPMPQSRVRM